MMDLSIGGGDRLVQRVQQEVYKLATNWLQNRDEERVGDSGGFRQTDAVETSEELDHYNARRGEAFVNSRVRRRMSKLARLATCWLMLNTLWTTVSEMTRRTTKGTFCLSTATWVTT